VSIYLMEASPPIGNVYPSSFLAPMPLTKAPQPIALPQRPHSVVLAPLFFPCVIMTFVSILAHPIRVF
jgi:hypothetical protein